MDSKSVSPNAALTALELKRLAAASAEVQYPAKDEDGKPMGMPFVVMAGTDREGCLVTEAKPIDTFLPNPILYKGHFESAHWPSFVAYVKRFGGPTTYGFLDDEGLTVFFDGHASLPGWHNFTACYRTGSDITYEEAQSELGIPIYCGSFSF